MGGRSSSVGVSSTGTNWGPQARLARLRLRVGVSLGGQEDDLDQAPVATGVGGLQHERDPADAGRGRFGGLDHAPGVEPRADFDRRVLAGWASVAAELAAGRPWFWLPAQMTSGLSGAWSDVQPVSRARRRRRNGELPPRGRSVTPVAGPGRWRGLGQAAAWRAGGRRSAEAVTDSTIQPAA